MKQMIKKIIMNFFCFPFKLNKPRGAVLTYHSVNPEKSFLSISPKIFEKQILFLKKNNFNFLKLKDLNYPEKLLRSKTVLLTFDDGFEDNFLNAVPVLKKYNVPAVFFVPVNFIGEKSFEKGFSYMSWKQIEEISKNPLFEIGSHTLNHKKLHHLSIKEAENEIKQSKEILEKNLGVNISSFAFPFGRYNENTLDILKETDYSFAFTTKPFLISKNMPLMEIPRFGINDFSSLFFSDIFKKGYELYWKIYTKVFNRDFQIRNIENRKIHNYLSLKFNQKKIWDRVAYKYLENCKTILDMGCGEGRFIAQNPNKIVGLDWNQESINKCRDKGFNVIKADVRNLPFNNKSISGIHCSHVLEHFLPEEAYKVLSEFNRVLIPSGILIIRAPLLWSGFYSDFTHIKPYTPDAIIHYLTSSNQRTLKHISFNFKVVYMKWRYQPFQIKIKQVDLLFRALNRWGFPWLKKNGYIFVLRKGSFSREKADK